MDARGIISIGQAVLWRLGGLLVGQGLGLAHGLATRWRGLRANTRRQLVALPISALLHLLLLVALLTTPAARQLGLGPSMEQGGRPSAHNGRGLSVSLLSWAMLGEIGRDTPSKASAVQAGASAASGPAQTRRAIAPTAPVLVAGGADKPGETPLKLAMAERSAAAAAAAQGLDAHDAIQSGDAEAGQNLLRQIGRCLPPDHRPVLDGVKLGIQLADDGQLAAAPSLDITPALASAEAIREANLVVQAALQCGPYQLPSPGVAAYALAADFSFMGPAGAARPRAMQRRGR